MRAAAEVGSTANSYQILAKLATGGMAEIFLARGQGVAGVERYCVLKRILRDRASDVQFVRMFLDEARLAAQLQHPHIAQVYDIGKLGDSYFFTMEYVHGETVRELLHRAQSASRRLPISVVLTVLAGAAAGLHHAHDRLGLDGRPLGIVHRDVSPSNLMVSYEGGVKVVDFGVAKAADRAEETKSGTVKGKISYLSPEQCKGRRVDRRSDLFSLGICFWELLTCERLYKRSTDFENMNAIVSEPPIAPSARRPDVPRELDELVLRLLTKSPDDRFQTAQQVVDAIEQVAARTSTVLSTSALARFMREVFGQRPEPWRELESRPEHGEAVTVTSEPIPSELVEPLVDEIDLQLSSVLDLSPPRAATESLESLGALGGMPVEPTQRIGRPMFGGPPPPAAPSKMIAATTARTSPETSRSRSLRATGPAPILVASADIVTASSGELLPLPRRSGTTAVTGAPSGPFAATSGAFAAPSHAQRLPGLVEDLPRRRWPTYAVVIASAAVIGALTVVLATRSAAVAPGAVAGALPTAKPTEPPAAPHPAPMVAGSGVAASPSVPPPTAIAAGSAIATPASAQRPPPTVEQMRSGPAAATPAPTRIAPPRPAVSRSARPATALVAPRGEPEDPIVRAFEDRSFDKVVAACSAGPVTAEHASLCFVAACHLHDEAKARQLLTSVAGASRERLLGTCLQAGLDLAIKKPPVVDCDADPMACQR